MMAIHFDVDPATNFQSQRDYRADINLVGQPVSVLAGTKDESFYTERLESIFREHGKKWPATLLPGIGQIPLTIDPRALRAAVQAVESMDRLSTNKQ